MAVSSLVASHMINARMFPQKTVIRSIAHAPIIFLNSIMEEDHSFTRGLKIVISLNMLLKAKTNLKKKGFLPTNSHKF